MVVWRMEVANGMENYYGAHLRYEAKKMRVGQFWGIIRGELYVRTVVINHILP